jgi:hypothetical protein
LRRTAQVIATPIKLDIGCSGMLAATHTEKSEFLVLKFERPIATATIAMAHQVIVDSSDNSVHFVNSPSVDKFRADISRIGEDLFRTQSEK